MTSISSRMSLTVAACLALNSNASLLLAQDNTETEAPKESSSETVLPEVRVEGAKEGEAAFPGGMLRRESGTGVLGTLNYMDSPVSSQSFTSDLIKDKQATRISEILELDPSMSQASSGASPYNDYVRFRGFAAFPRDSIYIHGLEGMVGYAPSINAVESVDFIKGPSSFLSGNTRVIGGSINYNMKRAGDNPLYRLGASYQSTGNVGGQIDVGQRFGDDKAYGIRLNSTYRDGDTAVKDARLLAQSHDLALDYRSDSFKVALDLGSEMNNSYGYSYYMALSPGLKLPKVPDSKRLMQPEWMTIYSENTRGILSSEWNVSKNWKVSAAYGQSFDGYGNDAYCFTILTTANGDASCASAPFQDRNKSESLALNVRGLVLTGPVSHTLAFGGSVLQETANSRIFPASTPIAFNYNIYAHDWPTKPSLPKLGKTKKYGEYETTGAYVGDTLGFADDSVLLTLGARQMKIVNKSFDNSTGTQVSKSDKEATTPAVGLVYKPIASVATFANYVEALQAGGIAPSSASNAGKTFKPLVSKQVEAGVKLDYGFIGSVLSVYRITQANEYTNALTNTYVQDGRQENTGVELTVFGTVNKDLRLMAGLTSLKAKLKETAGGVNEGNDAPSVPKFEGRLNAEWSVPGAEGLSLSATALHTGKAPLDSANSQNVDAWTRYDLGAIYASKLAQTPLNLRLSVENVSNEKYWVAGFDGAVAISGPRTYLASAAIDL